ncbi:hypothetical protein CRYUN_Cryun33cG0103500 [Craigia yunnanensis]
MTGATIAAAGANCISSRLLEATKSKNRDAYLQLSITVLSAFCRVPEIASSEEMVSKIPMILEVMSKESGSPVLEECYEFLYFVSTASEDGLAALYESGGMKLLTRQMPTLPDGSHLMALAMNLVQLMLRKLSQGIIENEHLSELSIIVAIIARQFALLQNAMKFETLHLLSAIFSSEYSICFFSHDCCLSGNFLLWCLLLVLESSRVEVAVLLNELAYSKYEASKSSSSNTETIISKLQKLTIAFSLVEKIIKLISNIGEIHISQFLDLLTCAKLLIDTVLFFYLPNNHEFNKFMAILLFSVLQGSSLFSRNLIDESTFTKDMSDAAKSEVDLFEIVTAGYSR